MWNQCQWWWGPGFLFGGPMGMLIGLIFWGAVIYGVVHLMSHLGKGRSADNQAGQVSVEILKRRYASGEIDTEEFEKRRRTLEA